MMILGIDPGLSGGLAWNWDGAIVKVCPMPTLDLGGKRDYDERAILDHMHTAVEFKLSNGELCFSRPQHIVFERQQAFPGQGVSSTFKTGMGFGLLRGLATASEIPFTIVSPITWQKVLFQGIGGDTKDVSKLVCSRLWPKIKFTLPKGKVAQDGMTDAALISEWWIRTQSGLHMNPLGAKKLPEVLTAKGAKPEWKPFRVTIKPRNSALRKNSPTSVVRATSSNSTSTTKGRLRFLRGPQHGVQG